MDTTKPLITSFLDNDLYKVTMQNAVAIRYPHAKVRYRFLDRRDMTFPEGFAQALRGQVELMGELSVNTEELAFLQKKLGRFLSPVYLDFLAGYRYNPDEVKISQDEAGKLKIEIEGYWYRTILWEVPLMALISELYFKMTDTEERDTEATYNASRKGMQLSDASCRFADFGTRRRYSYDVHDKVIGALSQFPNCVGTSNMHFAKKYDLRPIGTQAHEWFMWHAAKYGFRSANSVSLGRWVDVYEGNLGIALTDTFTTTDFWRTFGSLYARLFDGVRHDSGDPIEFGEKVIEHYQGLGIDPMTKTIVFSDGLDVDTAIKIAQAFSGRIDFSFGIGTNFTNDVGVQPLNMVIKMVEAEINEQWVSTIKLSDVEGKHTGSQRMIDNCKITLGIY